MQASHRERQGAAGGGAQGREFGRNANLSYGLEGGPMSVPLSVGQKQVARVHPLSGVSGGLPQSGEVTEPKRSACGGRG